MNNILHLKIEGLVTFFVSIFILMFPAEIYASHIDSKTVDGKRPMVLLDNAGLVNDVTLVSDSDFTLKEGPKIGVNITGRIVDSEGEPLIGVNILVKGANKGTTTD